MAECLLRVSAIIFAVTINVNTVLHITTIMVLHEHVTIQYSNDAACVIA